MSDLKLEDVYKQIPAVDLSKEPVKDVFRLAKFARHGCHVILYGISNSAIKTSEQTKSAEGIASTALFKRDLTGGVLTRSAVYYMTTSEILGIDPKSCLIKTRNSVYGIEKISQ